MGIWAGWPCRAKAVGRARPHEGGPALTGDERRRFDEIARRIDRDVPASGVDEVPPTTAVVPVRLAALGLFVVGLTGVLTGLARSDTIVLVVVGIVPAAVATILIALARASGPSAAPAAPLFRRFWSWLTTCAEDGCTNHPVHLGWCREHAPGYDSRPEEYWGDDPR
jgi:hypothetical protein